MANYPKQMKAAYYTEYGGPEVIKIGEIATPIPDPDQLIVKVAATSFNAFDAYLRMGGLGEVSFPHIPHIDFGGIVVSVGENVDKFNVGDRVFGAQMLNFFRDSCAAEYVAVNPDEIPIAKAPKSLSLVDCAALPAVSLTAYQGIVDHCKLQKDQKIFISGAAGGVGSMAIQFAKLQGACVIGSDSADAMDIMRTLGADEVMDYKTDTLDAYAPEKVDAIYNIAPVPSEAVTQLLYHVKKGGILVSTLNPADEAVAEACGVNAMCMAVAVNSERLNMFAQMVDQGKIKPYITGYYPLEEVVAFNTAAMSSHGKLILVVDETL